MEKAYRFLMLEDEPADAELVQREIRKEFESAVIMLVATRNEFIKEISDFKPEIILSDFVIPSFGGYEALGIAGTVCPDIPFIFVSGSLGEESSVQALREGATDYVFKENLSKLCPAIKRALDESKEKIDRRKAEKQLKESEERYRTLINDVLDTSQVGVFILDKGFKIVWINKIIEVFFDLKRENLIGMDKREVIKKYIQNTLAEPDDYTSTILSAFEKNNYIENFECKILTSKGRDERWLRHWSQPIRTGLYKGGRIEHYYDITHRKKTEEEIKSALKEKEILLREIHHRVKNNMQVISSLLRLKSNLFQDDDIKKAFEESQNRIRTMSLVHERLYRSGDLANIEFSEYVKILANELIRFYELNTYKVKLILDLQDIKMSVDKAIPCGLIINEILSNSMKYAFPANTEGEIKILLKQNNVNEAILCLMDNGVGLPKDIDVKHTNSLGIKLIYLLGEDQLEAAIELDRTNGTKYCFKFNMGN